MSWNYFKREEFECPCGCGENKIQDELINLLDEARSMCDFPFHINSGYRCITHNKAVGGKRTSAHRYGLAADIACYDSHKRWSMLDVFFTLGVHRIGVSKNFIHVDIDEDLPKEVVWLY